MNISSLNFYFQPNINVETTLVHRRSIDVVLLMLCQGFFVNVKTMWINIRRLNFHYQPNFNVQTMLVYRRWIDVIISTFFQRCNNVKTTSINVRRLSFHFQPNMKVETTLINVDDQGCFNIDSTLICLLGYWTPSAWCMFFYVLCAGQASTYGRWSLACPFFVNWKSAWF